MTDMEMKHDIITEEDLIAFIAESMDEFEPEDAVEEDTSQECRYDYWEDRVTEDDIARENGFWVDDDGHWQELDEEW